MILLLHDTYLTSPKDLSQRLLLDLRVLSYYTSSVLVLVVRLYLVVLIVLLQYQYQ